MDLTTSLKKYRGFELRYVAKQYKIKVSEKKETLILNIVEKLKTNPELKNPIQIIKDDYKEIIEKPKKNFKKLINEKNFYNVISNIDLGFFNGLPKDCLLHICSFLSEIEVYLFSLSNKTIRTIFKTPTLKAETLKFIMKQKVMIFIPKEFGEFLHIDKSMMVNKYYLVPKKLLALVIVYTLRNHYTITKKEIKKSRFFVHLKESIKDILPLNQKQTDILDKYLKRSLNSSNLFNILTYEFKSLEWDLTRKQIMYIHSEICYYQKKVEDLVSQSI